MAELSQNQNNTSNSSNNFFNERWKLYQKILNNNYMGHQEIYSILHKFLLNRYDNKPFKMLELGCGDATFTTQALLNSTMNFYCGVDLSQPALKIARENMAKLPCKKQFIEGNLFDFVFQLEENSENKFDLVLASFVLHHLSFEQKELLINQLPNLLKTDGIFVLIDIIRSSQENRETYIKRYVENISKYWFLLTDEEFLQVEEHMFAKDFPETQETLYSIAQKHSFSQIDCLYSDDLETTQLLCFYQ